MCTISSFHDDLGKLFDQAVHGQSLKLACEAFTKHFSHDLFYAASWERGSRRPPQWQMLSSGGEPESGEHWQPQIDAISSVTAVEGFPTRWMIAPALTTAEQYEPSPPPRAISHGYMVRVNTNRSTIVCAIGYAQAQGEIGRKDVMLGVLGNNLYRLGLRLEQSQGKGVLSERERTCLEWACKGKTAWEIAIILTISERTVAFHLNNAAEKLNAANRQHACAIATAAGLIDAQSVFPGPRRALTATSLAAG